jgi:hypothetical protein
MDLPQPVVLNARKLIERRLIGAVEQRAHRSGRWVDAVTVAHTGKCDSADTTPCFQAECAGHLMQKQNLPEALGCARQKGEGQLPA